VCEEIEESKPERRGPREEIPKRDEFGPTDAQRSMLAASSEATQQAAFREFRFLHTL